MRHVLRLPSQVVAALLPTASAEAQIMNVAMYSNDPNLLALASFVEEKNTRRADARLYANLTLEYDDQEKKKD